VACRGLGSWRSCRARGRAWLTSAWPIGEQVGTVGCPVRRCPQARGASTSGQSPGDTSRGTCGAQIETCVSLGSGWLGLVSVVCSDSRGARGVWPSPGGRWTPRPRGKALSCRFYGKQVIAERRSPLGDSVASSRPGLLSIGRRGLRDKRRSANAACAKPTGRRRRLRKLFYRMLDEVKVKDR